MRQRDTYLDPSAFIVEDFVDALFGRSMLSYEQHWRSRIQAWAESG
jgi:hypothetical protein